MSASTLLPTIHRRLDGLAHTIQRLKGLLARAPNLPPTHEVRLSNKLRDVQADLQEIIAMTETLAAVHQDKIPPT